MANSIAKAQAKLLSSGFLDKIGSKEGLRAKNSLSAIFKVAGILIETAQDNLNKADKVASGALSESIIIIDPKIVNKTVEIPIQLLYYYKFIDQGVKGTKKGSGKYSFKHDFPNKEMVKSIQKWLKKEGLKAKTDVGGKSITKREARRKKITDTTKNAAYGISVAVKQKGIRKTLFWTNAVKKAEREADRLLGDALKLDILEAIPTQI